ncbi:MAG: hypothetical protein AAF318_04510 [Pseudomonadota bacterium]
MSLSPRTFFATIAALAALIAVLFLTLDRRISATNDRLLTLAATTASTAERLNTTAARLDATAAALTIAAERQDGTLAPRIDRTIERVGVLSDQNLEFAAALARLTAQIDRLTAAITGDKRTDLAPISALGPFFAQNPASAALREAATRHRLAHGCLSQPLPPLIGNGAAEIVPSIRCQFLREAPEASFEALVLTAKERLAQRPPSP